MQVLPEFFRAAALLLFAFALFCVVYARSSAPSRIASRLGLRGLHRQRALRRNELWARIEPLVRWLGVRLNGLLPPDTYESIDSLLQRGGEFLGLTPDEFVGLSMLSTFAGACAGLLFMKVGQFGDMAIILGAMLGAAMPYLEANNAATERAKKINRGLPGVIDLLALGMSAGLDFPNAVRQVVEKSSDPTDPLIEEIALLLQELKLGRTRAQALRSFAARAHSVAVDEFVGAVLQAEERGNPVADALQIQAEAARMRRTVRAEELASSAAAKLLIPVSLLMVSALLLAIGPTFIKIMSAKMF